jgi:hypothetical protein
MAVAATHVTSWVTGNKKARIFNLVFSGNYQDDGSESTLTAAQVRLKKIEGIFLTSGAAAATNLATANPIAVTVASTGATAEFTLYEDNAAAAAAPLTEKTDNEAFITGCNVTVLAIGI